MHMIKLIIEIESKLTSQSVLKPTTPSSMDMMLNATHKEQIGLGINTRDTVIMTTAAMLTHWMVVGKTIRNWSKKMKCG